LPVKKYLPKNIFQQRQAPVTRYTRQYDDHDNDQYENGHSDFIFQDVLSVEDRSCAIVLVGGQNEKSFGMAHMHACCLGAG